MPLDALAPDQRAVVQLVLQRGRSYAQIAELLKISEDAVRARAHAGLIALAPEVELPADEVAQIADFLLGQQEGKPRQATRRLLRDSDAAYLWAVTVRASVEDLGPVPELPEGGDKAAPADAPLVATDGDPLAAADGEPAKPAPRPRPLREAHPRKRPVAATETDGRDGRVVVAARRGAADRRRRARGRGGRPVPVRVRGRRRQGRRPRSRPRPPRPRRRAPPRRRSARSTSAAPTAPRPRR